MKAQLMYFKLTGKWFMDTEWEVPIEYQSLPLFEIWDYLRRLQRIRRLPGLHEGHSAYDVVVVSVKDHPRDHPVLLNYLDCEK